MKTVLVTGASRGIGEQLAVDFAKAGYNVAVNYNSSKEKALEIKRQHRNINIYKCDMASYSAVEKMYAEIMSSFGNIDVVVNNAGVSYCGLLQDMEEAQINTLISTNLSGVIYSCQQAAKIMVKNHEGVIVNISSIWGEKGASCEAVYSASKGGVISFTKALAQELAPSGIRVNSVSPGVIKTDMLCKFNKGEIEALVEETPLGRLGIPQDISKAVLFLAQESASFITGQNLTVDGGFSL